ncbi:hypothetical protein [Paenibacillus lautus]|uniref:hypothetical protein n=1 Tax=Paenibacillus lautus TaxID=1401 RepID=UPI001C7D45C6|nr:hypothetical protein [Paenibacillus lautus]MBX4152229.1 hypothetical protein [Paenibacillus lautus]
MSEPNKCKKCGEEIFESENLSRCPRCGRTTEREVSGKEYYKNKQLENEMLKEGS